MDDKTKAIVSHITIIGWIVALVLNQAENKTELATFYIRQMLGLGLLSLIGSLIPVLNFFIWIVFLVLWVVSLLGSLNGEKKLLPVVGEYFQDWFKAL